MERTDHIDLDALLHRILSEPTYAADLLTATAEQLEDECPFLVMTEDQFTAAANEASEQILENLPAAVAREACERAYGALPAIRAYQNETCGEYALRLRAAAEHL